MRTKKSKIIVNGINYTVQCHRFCDSISWYYFVSFVERAVEYSLVAFLSKLQVKYMSL
jgi:hypothetical protein